MGGGEGVMYEFLGNDLFRERVAAILLREADFSVRQIRKSNRPSRGTERKSGGGEDGVGEEEKKNTCNVSYYPVGKRILLPKIYFCDSLRVAS